MLFLKMHQEQQLNSVTLERLAGVSMIIFSDPIEWSSSHHVYSADWTAYLTALSCLIHECTYDLCGTCFNCHIQWHLSNTINNVMCKSELCLRLPQNNPNFLWGQQGLQRPAAMFQACWHAALQVFSRPIMPKSSRPDVLSWHHTVWCSTLNHPLQ